MSDKEWLAVCSVYAKALIVFELPIFSESCQSAYRQHVQFFPTLGQLENICNTVKKCHVQKNQKRFGDDLGEPDPDAKRKIRELIDSVFNGKTICGGVE